MKVALTFLSSLLITCEKQTALPDTAARHSGNSSAVYMEHSCILELKQTLQSMCFSVTLLLAYLKCILRGTKEVWKRNPRTEGQHFGKTTKFKFLLTMLCRPQPRHSPHSSYQVRSLTLFSYAHHMKNAH